MGRCGGLQGGTLWTSSSAQSLEFTWKKFLVWRFFLRHYLSQISLLLTAMCVNQRAFRYFPKIHLFYTRAIYLWLGAFPTEGLKSCVCSAPWWFTAHCMCTCHLFSIHHQNNAKHALLYAFQYSQLSSNRLPMVHDKVVAYRRLSSVGKKKKNISNFCPKKRSWSFKKVVAYWLLMRNGYERNDCILKDNETKGERKKWECVW